MYYFPTAKWNQSRQSNFLCLLTSELFLHQRKLRIYFQKYTIYILNTKSFNVHKHSSVTITQPTPDDLAFSWTDLISQVSAAHCSATTLSSVMRKLSKTISSLIDHSSSPTAPCKSDKYWLNLNKYILKTKSFLEMSHFCSSFLLHFSSMMINKSFERNWAIRTQYLERHFLWTHKLITV